jgi:hypothetical protein
VLIENSVGAVAAGGVTLSLSRGTTMGKAVDVGRKVLLASLRALACGPEVYDVGHASPCVVAGYFSGGALAG